LSEHAGMSDKLEEAVECGQQIVNWRWESGLKETSG